MDVDAHSRRDCIDLIRLVFLPFHVSAVYQIEKEEEEEEIIQRPYRQYMEEIGAGGAILQFM